MSKHKTKEIEDKYFLMEDKEGVNFEEVIMCGLECPDAHIGICAGSPDSYTAFKELFDKVIEEYHSFKADAVHINNMDCTSLECLPFKEEESKYVKSVELTVYRSV